MITLQEKSASHVDFQHGGHCFQDMGMKKNFTIEIARYIGFISSWCRFIGF